MHLNAERLLILGTGPFAAEIRSEVEARPSRYWLLGVVTESPSPAPPPLREKLLGSLENLPAILERLRPERIVVAFDGRPRRLPIQVLLEAKMRGILVERGEAFYERVSGEIAIETLAPAAYILAPELRWSCLEFAVGRALNVLLALVAAVLMAPVFVIIAAAIRIDSGAPVLFSQERVGLAGRSFRLAKFRTMRPVEHACSEWAGDNGHRITRVGRWLRRFRLDELPQVINILRGDMNWVGPRPHPASNFAMLSTVARNAAESGACIPYYALRSSVRPGITGWAQIRYGYANDVVEEMEKLRFDLYYVKHRSFALDFRILAETLAVVFSGRESVENQPATAAPHGAIRVGSFPGGSRIGRDRRFRGSPAST